MWPSGGSSSVVSAPEPELLMSALIMCVQVDRAKGTGIPSRRGGELVVKASLQPQCGA